jgi:hypothetical protein
MENQYDRMIYPVFSVRMSQLLTRTGSSNQSTRLLKSYTMENEKYSHPYAKADDIAVQNKNEEFERKVK